MATYCIYKLTNMITFMAYVGKTETDRFDDRMGEHEDPTSNPTTLITKAINKYGIENFKVEKLIDNVEKDVDENFYIQRENTMAPHGYNKQRGDGSGTVTYNEYHKRWKVLGPAPDSTFVGYYDNEEKAERARDLFVRTGERMESDRIMRKKGTGSIHVTKSGRFNARITVKGTPYTGTFDTWDEGDAFCIRIKNTYS